MQHMGKASTKTNTSDQFGILKHLLLMLQNNLQISLSLPLSHHFSICTLKKEVSKFKAAFLKLLAHRDANFSVALQETCVHIFPS